MKSFVAATGLLALANAYQPRNLHWRRQNDTITASSEAGAGFTTLTVEVTEVATITSCASTITDCPAVSSALPEKDLVTVEVTNTIVLTETVCPISEAENIKTSVIKEHETGSLIGSTRVASSAPVYDLPTQTPGPSSETASDALPIPGITSSVEAEKPVYSTEVITETTDIESVGTISKTLTYGNGTSVIESLTTSTIHTTVVKTITACPGGCSGEDEEEGEVPTPITTAEDQKPTEEVVTEVSDYETVGIVTKTIGTNVYEELTTSTIQTTVVKTITACPGGCTGEESDDDEITSTTTATTTGTKTVTVPPQSTSDEAKPETPVGETPEKPEVPGTCSGSGEQCLCPSAVTVTIPASTVYVTITGQNSPTSAPTPGESTGKGEDESSEEGDDEEDDEEDYEEGDDEDDYEDCPVEDVVTVSQTVTVEPIPYPTGGNGTSAYPVPTGAYRVRSHYAPAPVQRLV